MSQSELLPQFINVKVYYNKLENVSQSELQPSQIKQIGHYNKLENVSQSELVSKGLTAVSKS